MKTELFMGIRIPRPTAPLLRLAILVPTFFGATLASAAWRENFQAWNKAWEIRGKPGTAKAVFENTVVVEKNGITNTVLRMKAENASASLLIPMEGVDLKKTPLLRWRWRVKTLPNDADGRDEKKDDQAIGIYVGMKDGWIRQNSVAYRWETLTPRESSGTGKYAAGAVRVAWFALRDGKDPTDTFFEEERNVAQDIQNAFGKLPENILLSISCNSQYTQSKSEAELDWIEFRPLPAVTNAPSASPEKSAAP